GGAEPSAVNPHVIATGAVQPALAYFEAEWSNLALAVTRAAELERWDVVRDLGDALQVFFAIHQHWSEEEHVMRLGRRAARALADRRAESRFVSYLATLCHHQGRWQAAAAFHED